MAYFFNFFLMATSLFFLSNSIGADPSIPIDIIPDSDISTSSQAKQLQHFLIASIHKEQLKIKAQQINTPREFCKVGHLRLIRCKNN